jgi:hypothetical protein
MPHAIAFGLARWLTDPHHPLTACVLSIECGHALVADLFRRRRTSVSRALLTHPELLIGSRDFIDHGWDIKRLCRTIVLSATYRQDSP